MIAQRTLDELYSKADLVDVIGAYVDLKKRGSNWVGLSPFGQEKTPSFAVNEAKGVWKDFSTGKGGRTAVQFVMEKEGMTFPEAVKHLAARYNVTIEEDNALEPEQISELEQMKETAQLAAEWYHNHLIDRPINDDIAAYVLKWRHINTEMVDAFQLGYAPNEWQWLTPQIIKADRWTAAEKIGLVKHSKGRNYDFFRHRIIFPIHHTNGHVVGFGARALDPEEKAKYINSSDSLLYNKSNVLYGLYQGRESIQRENLAYLVEGYTDVIAMHQAGYTNTVASCGTAFTEGQAKLLKRYTKRVVIWYDPDVYEKPDENGEIRPIHARKAWTALDLLLKEGISVQICRTDQDPADMLQEYLTPEI